jgi:DNA-binding winged helix-turn-helix (wHTH) protein
VEKDTLLQTVRPDMAVEEGNRTNGVFSLRQVLGQDEEELYIKTVPKRGYRFVAVVTTGPPVVAPSAPSTGAAL